MASVRECEQLLLEICEPRRIVGQEDFSALEFLRLNGRADLLALVRRHRDCRQSNAFELRHQGSADSCVLDQDFPAGPFRERSSNALSEKDFSPRTRLALPAFRESHPANAQITGKSVESRTRITEEPAIATAVDMAMPVGMAMANSSTWHQGRRNVTLSPKAAV